MNRHFEETLELDYSSRNLKWGIWHGDAAQEIENYRRLVSLNLANNNIDYVPLNFLKLPHLRKLGLSNNDLGYWGMHNQFSIGYNWEKLGSLQILDLNFNNIGYLNIKPNVNFIDTLTELHLSYNSFKDFGIRKHLFFKVALPKFSKLAHLSLAGNCFTSVPKISHLTSLRVLDLGCNKISANFHFLSYLNNIEILKINHNSLKELPKVIYTLEKLRVLDISGNNLSQDQINVVKTRLPGVELLL